jgi:hypothetical protein
MKEFADYISDAFVHCTMVYHEGKFDIKAIYANKQLEKITNKTFFLRNCFHSFNN